jgi:DNA-binding transcriptional MerR regulator
VRRHYELESAMVAIRPISLDSGPRSRLYDFVMAIRHQTESMAMQIGEVAKRTSLTVDAIRFYEKRRLLPKAVRTAGRFRLYGEGTIERLRFIQQMQGLGFSLREVGELIQLRDRKVDGCESVRAEGKPDRCASEAARATASGVGARNGFAKV